MPKLILYNTGGGQVGDIELSDAVFNVQVSKDMLHRYVLNYLANQRQGTQSTLTRTEVRGGGRKPWRQKGTGRARQGSIRSPQWTGGGVVFAPKPRDYRYAINKKERRLAIKSALTSKVLDKDMLILDDIQFNTFKTKETAKLIKIFDIDNALFVTLGVNKNLVISAGNIPRLTTTIVTALNAYDILKHKKLIITRDAVKKLEEMYA